jgi:hypothetical protein
VVSRPTKRAEKIAIFKSADTTFGFWTATSGASLTKQQHRGIVGSHSLDQLQHVGKRGTVADDLIDIHLAANLFFEIKLLLRQLVFELRNLLVRKSAL